VFVMVPEGSGCKPCVIVNTHPFCTLLPAESPNCCLLSAVCCLLLPGIRNGHRGLYGRWKGLLADWLDQLLPPDAAITCSTRVTLLTTAMPWLYTQVGGWVGGLMSGWVDEWVG
jgi:hypothetical protein